MIRLYVIDDHYLIIEGLYSTFNLESDDFMVVGGSLTIADALEEISHECVDIIILDLFIGNTDPIANLKLVRGKVHSVPIVILSHESNLLWQIIMFKHGIKAYLGKNENKSVMRQKLQRVFSGEIVMPNDVGQALIYCGEDESQPMLPDSFQIIITYLANGLSIKQIAGKMNQSESSIDKKLQKIRQCFHVNSNYELIYKVFIKNTPYSTAS